MRSAGHRVVAVELGAGVLHGRQEFVELTAELSLAARQFFEIGLLLRLEIFPLLAKQFGPSFLVAC